VRQIFEIATTLIFAAIFAIFIYAIVQRYVFGHPVAWADELNIILLLWVMFLGGALVLRDDDHVAFDIVWNAVRPPTRRVMGIVAAVAFGALFLAALPGTLSYIAFLWRERTTVLEWRLDWVYSCFVLFFVSIILRFGAALVRLLGPHWRQEVGE
jgi:TRAP-type C4-dicarboxylate transport system permease small subunit